MMKKLIVDKALRVAKPGEPHVRQIAFREGEFDADKYPDWAVEHLVKKKYGKLQKGKATARELTDEEKAALEKAKKEAEAK